MQCFRRLIQIQSYVMYPSWCDVRSCFIYIRETKMCYIVLQDIILCSDGMNKCSELGPPLIERESKGYCEYVIRIQVSSNIHLYFETLSGDFLVVCPLTLQTGIMIRRMT